MTSNPRFASPAFASASITTGPAMHTYAHTDTPRMPARPGTGAGIAPTATRGRGHHGADHGHRADYAAAAAAAAPVLPPPPAPRAGAPPPAASLPASSASIAATASPPSATVPRAAASVTAARARSLPLLPPPFGHPLHPHPHPHHPQILAHPRDHPLAAAHCHAPPSRRYPSLPIIALPPLASIATATAAPAVLADADAAHLDAADARRPPAAARHAPAHHHAVLPPVHTLGPWPRHLHPPPPPPGHPQLPPVTVNAALAAYHPRSAAYPPPTASSFADDAPESRPAKRARVDHHHHLHHSTSPLRSPSATTIMPGTAFDASAPSAFRPPPPPPTMASVYPASFIHLVNGTRAGPDLRPPAPVAPVVALESAPAASSRRSVGQASRRLRERVREREAVVQWLVHMNAVHAAFRFAPETLYSAVQYLDRVLAAFPDPRARRPLLPRRAHLYLLAAVCLLVAAKFSEEYTAPSIASVVDALATVPAVAAADALAGPIAATPLGAPFGPKHVLAMERRVLELLEFRLATVAPSAAVFELLFADPRLALALCRAVDGTASCRTPHSPAAGASFGGAAAFASPSHDAHAAGGYGFAAQGAAESARARPPVVLPPPSPISPTATTSFAQQLAQGPSTSAPWNAYPAATNPWSSSSNTLQLPRAFGGAPAAPPARSTSASSSAFSLASMSQELPHPHPHAHAHAHAHAAGPPPSQLPAVLLPPPPPRHRESASVLLSRSGSSSSSSSSAGFRVPALPFPPPVVAHQPVDHAMSHYGEMTTALAAEDTSSAMSVTSAHPPTPPFTPASAMPVVVLQDSPAPTAIYEAEHAPMSVTVPGAPHAPTVAPPATTAADAGCLERWPVPLHATETRMTLARVVRAVQTELIQRVLVHPAGTAHAPMNVGVALLNRAVAGLAAGRAAEVPCMAARADDRDAFAACARMVAESCCPQ
ncbi:hypothetical protein H9P43_005944 [Blastocladiella emersonii ATCC 22665]|nr:hypothetical protein H9P43_005944 [Blastocladiella emersonii ATCC 22665]